MSDPYSDLGVPKDASPEDIKKAYRKKAGKTHPDKAGGDKEAFQKASKAYALLSDSSRRSDYDKTGRDGIQDENAVLLQELAQLMFSIIDQVQDVMSTNILEIMNQNIHQHVRQVNEEIRKQTHAIEKRKVVIKRFHKKKGKGKDSIVVAMLKADVDKRMTGIERANEQIAKLTKMLGLLNDYEYRCDSMPSFSSSSSTSTHGFGPTIYIRGG